MLFVLTKNVWPVVISLTEMNECGLFYRSGFF